MDFIKNLPTWAKWIGGLAVAYIAYETIIKGKKLFG